MQQAERGLFDLRRGHTVYLEENGQALLTVPVETMSAGHLSELPELAGTRARLLITAERARALGLDNPQDTALSIQLPRDATVSDLLSFCAAPLSVLDTDSVRRASRPATPLEDAALALAKAGRLLPAMLSVTIAARPGERLQTQLDDHTLLRVPAGQARELARLREHRLKRISEAPVPLEDAEQTRFVLFRESSGVLEHVAVIIGNPGQWPDPVPVRVHSACLTGDLFGSLRCDCGEQLRNGVRAIREHGGGVLLYLSQEGRGIGLANKLRAYTIQDHGVDTVDADGILGFTGDGRRYEAAVDMLRQLRVQRVLLFTNNPDKVAALTNGGVTVVERRPLHGSVTPHNRRYLHTKARKAGHMLDELLQDGDVAGKH
ncbi:MAG: GTP cyclohydrolase II RibA [Ectothiorhodospiraceae bacterium]|nr:GTP cyclohydrolase II RibA [Ectothiorhodospiraceae bacterium]